MNCKQYQDDLAARAINDSAARRTTQLLKVICGIIYFHCQLILMIIFSINWSVVRSTKVKAQVDVHNPKMFSLLWLRSDVSMTYL